MASATTSAPITCTGAPLQAVETDFLAVPWFEGEGPSAVGILDGATGGEIARGRILGECSNLARDMANEPGNALTPREFARRCQNVVADAGVSFEALDEQQIEKLGMGLLLGVARGSSEPPRLMVFRYEP